MGLVRLDASSSPSLGDEGEVTTEEALMRCRARSFLRNAAGLSSLMEAGLSVATLPGETTASRGETKLPVSTLSWAFLCSGSFWRDCVRGVVLVAGSAGTELAGGSAKVSLWDAESFSGLRAPAEAVGDPPGTLVGGLLPGLLLGSCVAVPIFLVATLLVVTSVLAPFPLALLKLSTLSVSGWALIQLVMRLATVSFFALLAGSAAP